MFWGYFQLGYGALLRKNFCGAPFPNNGGYLWLCGQFMATLLALQRALRILGSEFGWDHIRLADVIMSIAMVYEAQGKYGEAISWNERALKIFEREFGVDHINSADTIQNIGIVYSLQGKYGEAISWYERALKIKEREFGVDHINSADVIMGIGFVYSSQGM